MAWARVVRGMQSVEKAVIERSASRCTASRFRVGKSEASSSAPGLMRSISWVPSGRAWGAFTFSTKSAALSSNAASGARLAPASR